MMLNKRFSAKKIFFLAAFIFFLFFSFNSFVQAVEPNCSNNNDCAYMGGKCVEQDIGGKLVKRCTRALEILYPQLPGQTQPTTVATGIPEYFKYIFQLAVIIIGIIVFGVFVYSGMRYLTSAGNPTILGDAKTGMMSALLGAVILLASFLIFNTVNPQLTVLSLPVVGISEQAVRSGVYICNYTYSESPSIDDILQRYIEKSGNEENQAVEDLQKVIVNPSNTRQNCLHVNFSGNFQNLVVKDNYTMFVVPRIKFGLGPTGDEYKKKPIYEFGLILHEKDDFGGKCRIYPIGFNGPIYTGTIIDNDGRERIEDGPYYPGTNKNNPVKDYTIGDLNFEAKSATVFKKPQAQPSPDLKGLTTYMCLDYDRTGMCPEYLKDFLDASGQPKYGGEAPSYKPLGTDDIRTNSLSTGNATYHENGGMRSAKLDKSDFYFAVFRDNKTPEDANCAVIKQSSPDITTIRIDKTGAGCAERIFYLPWTYIGSVEKCVPKIEDIVVIKGKML